MQIFDSLNYNPNLSICLGFFDGVHQGHKVVLKNTVNLARQNNIKSAVITFKEHPLCYLQNRKPQYILPLNARLELMKEQGIDFVYLLDFNEDIADALAIDYLKEIIIKNFEPKFITTGFNHYFGANKQGDTSFLRQYSKIFGYEFYEIPPITYNNTLISSSKIRQLITDGEMEQIPNLLGEPFNICGRVITGERLGRTINYPTANIKYPTDIIKLKKGVYATLVKINNKTYKAMANFGKRPTVNGIGSLLEVHLFDFNENIYDEDIKVFFVKNIRNEIKFDSIEALKMQLKKDETTIREYLNNNQINLL